MLNVLRFFALICLRNTNTTSCEPILPAGNNNGPNNHEASKHLPLHVSNDINTHPFDHSMVNQNDSRRFLVWNLDRVIEWCAIFSTCLKCPTIKGKSFSFFVLCPCVEPNPPSVVEAMPYPLISFSPSPNRLILTLHTMDSHI